MQNYHFKIIPRSKFVEMSMKGGILVASSPVLMNHLISCAPSSVGAGGLDLDKVVLNNVIARGLSRGGNFTDVYLENRMSRQIVMEESRN